MTRQEAVIKIAKITRIIGEWKYRLDLDGEVEIETLSPDLLHIDEWAREIGLYMKQNPSPILARQITNIGFTDLLERMCGSTGRKSKSRSSGHSITM